MTRTPEGRPKFPMSFYVISVGFVVVGLVAVVAGLVTSDVFAVVAGGAGVLCFVALAVVIYRRSFRGS